MTLFSPRTDGLKRRSVKALAKSSWNRFYDTLFPAPANYVHVETLAWRAVLAAGVVVFLFGLLDWTYGADSENRATGWHFLAVACQGVACSAMASATYSLFVEDRHARARQKLRDDFTGLFGLPEMTGSPKCFIVVPTSNNIALPARDQDGNNVAVGVPLSVPIQKGPDVACASELQSMITSVFGTTPQWVSVEAAIDIANSSTDPSIVFAVGLWSNPFTLFLAEGGAAPLQRLLRLPVQNVHKVRLATPAASGEYNVDRDFEDTDVPGDYRGGEVVLLRARGPNQGHVACVIVGGLTADGTEVIGRYLRDNWRELSSVADTSSSARCVRHHQFVIHLKAFLNGRVATTGVMVGSSLSR